MNTVDFDYVLPTHLIAQTPSKRRADSRLLVLSRATNTLAHKNFKQIIDFLSPGDLLVLNNTKVIPARFYGEKATGGRIEILLDHILSSTEARAHIRASKAPKPGSILRLADAFTVTMAEKHNDLYVLRLNASEDQEVDWWKLTQRYGRIPLPLYIQRTEDAADRERYQTVYAQTPGAMAAPTAGLHFDDELLTQIQQKGIALAYVTLHVSSGTFLPVRVSDIREHQMHEEWISVTATVCEQIKKTKLAGGRVIAIGTTSVRCLESAVMQNHGGLAPFTGYTDIFIYPGFRFQCVDALLTNFHWPQSTLLMLVSAFASREQILATYQEAIHHEYRFFSYGDAMLIL